MVYQKLVRKRNKVVARRQRFGKYLKKVEAENKAKQEAARKLSSVIKLYQEKRNLEYWEHLTTTILPKMKSELEELGDVPFVNKPVDVINYAIKFMDIVSRYQDSLEKKMLLLYPDSSKEDSIDFFNGTIYIAGRHSPYERRKCEEFKEVPYWNQSKFGEAVTKDNVFFGPDIGLQKKPASYWLELPNIKRNKIYLEVCREVGGKYKKTKPLWPTEAIVKYGYGGVQRFCVVLRENLLNSIGDLIS